MHGIVTAEERVSGRADRQWPVEEYKVDAPMIWPPAAMDTFSGTMSVVAPVPRRLPVSQESMGPATEKANETATQRTA